MAKTITLSENEFKKLRNKAEINSEVVDDFKKSLEDLRKGRVRIRS
jgi:hypothetical protein